jgi:hypothetical protein
LDLLRSYEGEEHTGWRPNWARTSVQSDITFGSLGDGINVHDSVEVEREKEEIKTSFTQMKTKIINVSNENEYKKRILLSSSQSQLQRDVVGSVDMSLDQIDDLLRESTELSESLSAYRKSRYGREGGRGKNSGYDDDCDNGGYMDSFHSEGEYYGEDTPSIPSQLTEKNERVGDKQTVKLGIDYGGEGEGRGEQQSIERVVQFNDTFFLTLGGILSLFRPSNKVSARTPFCIKLGVQ